MYFLPLSISQSVCFLFIASQLYSPTSSFPPLSFLSFSFALWNTPIHYRSATL